MTPADFLIITRYADAVEVRERFQTCKTKQLSVTTAVVNAMLINENRNEIMRELLCGNCHNIHVEVDAALGIVKTFGPLCTEYLLCHKHGVFFGNQKVIREIVPQDTNNADEKARSLLLSVLTDGYLETARLMLAM